MKYSYWKLIIFTIILFIISIIKSKEICKIVDILIDYKTKEDKDKIKERMRSK